MKLIVVESPSKAKTISKYLGSEFRVLASVGHVRDLPKSNKKAIDIDNGFIPNYEIVAKKESVINDIRKQANRADEILLATDPDREGEAIAWHLQELLTDKRLGGNIAKKDIKRITYHEVTKEAVEEALQQPRPIDDDLRRAQEARRVLDRLVGYDLSGLVWKKVRYGLSAGRVQSPALRIIMEREREIRAFLPEDYWSIRGLWQTEGGSDLVLTCVEEPRDKKLVDSILGIAKTEKWFIKDVEESQAKRSPRAPFITSTLQQTASNRYGFTPSRTMSIAQKLYEAGHITYMRTDSTNLGGQAIAQIAGIVEKKYGKEYLTIRKFVTKSKNAQEAHESIRPTHFNRESVGHTDEQKRLYRLIWQRAVASQMSDARVAKTKIVANVSQEGGEDPSRGPASESADSAPTARPPRPPQVPLEGLPLLPDFTAIGSRILFDGWLRADPESSGEEVTLPKCDKGQSLTLKSIEAEAKQTQPPSRYTEAGLIKELEKRGIGRPSTYASICKTIEDRGYVTKENKSLRPTDTGDVVSSFLEEYFPTYISDTFTAEMENELDEIAEGKRTYEKTLGDFYKPFLKEIKSKDKLAKITNLGQSESKLSCPKCGSNPMDIKLGRNGKFLSCSKYPDCDGALTLDGHEFKKDEPIGTDPETGLPIFVLNGRFGPYVQLGVKVAKKRRKNEKKSDNDQLEQVNGVQPSTINHELSTDQQLTTKTKPRMASIPRGTDPSKVTIADALKYLSIPRELGIDPKTNKKIVASIGRFGPYISRDGEFRSIKPPLDVYTITLDQALELLAQEKKPRGFQKRPKK